MPGLCLERPLTASNGLTDSDIIPGGCSDLVVGPIKLPSTMPNNLAELDLPVDVSSLLTAPSTPNPRKLSRGKDRFLKSVRKSRAICLRTPVVSVIIGRQLSGPITMALRAIAKEEIPDVTSVVAVVTPPVPAPVPVPV